MDTYAYDSEEILALKDKLYYRMEPYKRKRIYAEIRKQRLKEAKTRGTHTEEEWEEILQIFDYRCVRCGCRPEPRPCKDHIVPICQGGSDHMTNLQPLCRECNTSQGNSHFNWLAYRFEYGFDGDE